MEPGWHAAAAPEADPETVREVLDRHWGIDGTLTPLYAERDRNYRVDSRAGTCLFKLSHPDTGAARLNYENALLEHLSRAPGAPAVPRPVPTVTGATLLPVPGLGLARVLDWLPGESLDMVKVDAAAREALGAACARLNLALQAHPPPAGVLPRDLPWDLQNLPALAALRRQLPDPACAPAVGDVLNPFATAVLPRLRALPRHTVHNDLNPDNLLFDPRTPGRVPAIIDFGDMVEAPVVCDLAIACAYLVDDTDEDAVAGVVDAVRGFHRERALTAAELGLLPLLIAGRLCQTLLIQGARISEGREGSGELEEVVDRAAGRLSRLDADGRVALGRRLLDSLVRDQAGTGNGRRTDQKP